MIDYKGLAERIKCLADYTESDPAWDAAETADLRTVVSLLEGMAERSHLYSYEAIVGAVARGWCHQKNKHKEMDADLAMAIANEVMEVLLHPAPQPQPTAIPAPFMHLLGHAYGLSLGTDWNRGTHAKHYRRPLLDAVAECKRWLGSAPQPQPERQRTEDPRLRRISFAEMFRDLPERQPVSEPTEAQVEEYEILCNGGWVAGASGPGALAEIAHYLTQYEQDGPCEVYAVTRRLVDRAALAAKEHGHAE